MSIPRSIVICCCLDGPYEGDVVRIGARAAFVDVRDSADASRRHERYQVVEIDGHTALKWAPTIPAADLVAAAEWRPCYLISVVCTECSSRESSNDGTATHVENAFVVDHSMLVDLRADLSGMTCVICGGTFEVKFLDGRRRRRH